MEFIDILSYTKRKELIHLKKLDNLLEAIKKAYYTKRIHQKKADLKTKKMCYMRSYHLLITLILIDSKEEVF